MSLTLQEYLHALTGKRLGVIGAGVSNTPLVRLLLAAGHAVTVCDRRTEAEMGETARELRQAGAALRLGPDHLEGLDFDVLFRTPGLHPFTPQLAKA